MNVIRAAVGLLPPPLIKAVGRWQFRVPMLRRLVNAAAHRAAAGEGAIQHGVGRGLRFDAAGGFPGYLFGTTDLHEQRALEATLGPGGVFYDVGANIGFYATLAGRLVGPGGRVVAFEPFGESAARLRNNMALNGFGDRLTLVEAAASDRAGDCRLAMGRDAMRHRLGDGEAAAGVVVPLVTLDGCRAERDLPPPDVVMIDVEGAECDVIRGMRGTIAECRPVVLVEVHYIPEAVREVFEEVLEPHGYAARVLDNGSVDPAAGWPTGPVRFHVVLEPTTRAMPGTPGT